MEFSLSPPPGRLSATVDEECNIECFTSCFTLLTKRTSNIGYSNSNNNPKTVFDLYTIRISFILRFINILSPPSPTNFITDVVVKLFSRLYNTLVVVLLILFENVSQHYGLP